MLGQVFVSSTRQERLVAEVVANHIRSMQVDKARLVDVRSSNRHKVKPWFNDKLDFSPPVPDLAPQGFELLGGRMDYLDGRPVAAVVYQRREHIISVILWPDLANVDTQTGRETRQGFHVFRWAHGGMNYFVVSDLNAEELDGFVHALK